MPVLFNPQSLSPSRVVHFILAGLFLLAGSVAEAQGSPEPIGQVMSLTPGAFVTRAGRAEALALKAPVYATDAISTNATGRVRLMFNDDSAVSLGPDTTLNLTDYADSGSKPVFNIHLGQGLARIVTGKITEANPAGFKASTPEAVIGIRGTIVSLRVGGQKTTVYVENALRQIIANGISVPSGFKIHFAPGVAPTPVLIQPQDRRELGQDLAFLGGAGVAAAAPEAGKDGEPPAATEQFVASAEAAAPVMDNTLSDAGTAMPTQTLINSMLPSTATMGFVSSSLTGQNGATGSVSFDVNLATGRVTNGTLTAGGTALDGVTQYSVTVAGGTGWIDIHNQTNILSRMTGSGPGFYGGSPISATATVYENPNISYDMSLVLGGSATPFLFGILNNADGSPIDAGSGIGNFINK